MRDSRKHIVLMGFMGSGKSTVGKRVADLSGRPFVDLDLEIVTHAGKSISEIFSVDGEIPFRKLEGTILKRLLTTNTPSIIATGGGAPCYYDNMDWITRYSLSFYLRVGVDALVRRLTNDQTRPLLENKSDAQLFDYIKETLHQRQRFYRQADRTVAAYDDPRQIARRVCRYAKLIENDESRSTSDRSTSR